MTDENARLDPAEPSRDIDHEADASAAMAALTSDEGARSVEDPRIDPNAGPLDLDDEREAEYAAADAAAAAAAKAARAARAAAAAAKAVAGSDDASTHFKDEQPAPAPTHASADVAADAGPAQPAGQPDAPASADKEGAAASQASQVAPGATTLVSSPADGTDAQPAPEEDPQATAEIDGIELAALMNSGDAGQTMPFAAVQAAQPPRPKQESDRISGAAKGVVGVLAWGSRSDVGLVREHNEDSFVVRFPLFAVADGMGGHEAGEVASSIAVTRLAELAPAGADDAELARAVESANMSVIEAPAKGTGRPGMGTTCTSVIIEGTTMAVAHVGDSRCYLLHKGQLMRVTHDHSYVEELVAAGQITAEEARVHPNRSVITRALGNDPKMQADHFTVDVARGDRILLCSDGLSSMVTDGVIEETLMSCTAPQSCADALVDAALAEGGSDNVTCIVIDVKNDGVAEKAFHSRMRNLGVGAAVVAAIAILVLAVLLVVSNHSWYLTDYNGYVALHRGIAGMPEALGMDETVEVTTVETSMLSDSVGRRLEAGITFSSEDEARQVIEDYREQTELAYEAKQGS